MRKPLRRVWTDFERNILRQMAEAGKSKIAIAARLKRRLPSITKEAKNLGLDLRLNKNVFSTEELKAQHRAFGLGKTEREKGPPAKPG